MNAPSLISVVIVNYNGRNYLEGCLSSLAVQTQPACEILLVDNGSTDGSVKWCRTRYPDVRILEPGRNLGFAAGNNLGIQAAKGEFIATLNNDTEVEPDYLTYLAEPMRDPRVGSVAPLMLEFNHRDRVDAAGITMDRAGFAWNRKAGANAREITAGGDVFGACAGAALYRRAMLEEIGLFDEDYFAFYEDVDFAWRAGRAGWKSALAPKARVYHIHGGSFRQGSEQKLYLLARNRWWTVIKNYPLRSLVLDLPLIVGADCISLLRSIVFSRSLAPWHGRMGALRGLPRMWNKRNSSRKSWKT